MLIRPKRFDVFVGSVPLVPQIAVTFAKPSHQNDTCVDEGFTEDDFHPMRAGLAVGRCLHGVQADKKCFSFDLPPLSIPTPVDFTDTAFAKIGAKRDAARISFVTVFLDDAGLPIRGPHSPAGIGSVSRQAKYKRSVANDF